MTADRFGQPNDMKGRFHRAVYEVNIIGLCESLGIHVRLQGGIPFINCLFHHDNARPNMALYPTPGERVSHPRGFCFSCKKVASALDIVMVHQGVNATSALKIIEGYMGSTPLNLRPAPTPTTQPPVNLRPAVDLVRERLWGKEGQDARDYLERRGILEVASEYQLGLWWDDHTSWSGRLVIPYLHNLCPSSAVFGMAGRTIGNDRSGVLSADNQQEHAGSERVRQVHNTPKYLYSKAKRREPYNWGVVHRRVEQEALLLITEGEIDCLTLLLASEGAYGIVGLGGAGAIGTLGQHLAGCTVIYIRDRGEESADEGHVRAVRLLREANATVYTLMPPEVNPGKTDLNDLLLAYGKDGLASWLTESIGELMYQNVRELV